MFAALPLALATSLPAQPTPMATSASPVATATATEIGLRPAGRHVLWYDQPTTNWYAALPVGNGRMGAMIFGGTTTEHLQLNENTIWSGGPYQPARNSAREAIMKARELVFKGTSAAQDEACGLLYRDAMGAPMKEASYQVLGDLSLTFPGSNLPATEYSRSLDLDTAIATTRYKIGDVTYTREVFASFPDRVIVARISGDKPGSVSFGATFVSPLKNFKQTAHDDTLVMEGRAGDYQKTTREYWLPDQIHASYRTPINDVDVPGVIVAQGRVRAKNDGGRLSVDARGLTVENADAVTLIISAATNFNNFQDVSGDPQARASATLEAAAKKSYDELKAAHLADYQALFRRVSIDLGQTPAAALPTDKRIPHFAKGEDPDLAALYFQYGRYLLISSSRPGGQPANLQGLWNGANFLTGELDMSGRGYHGSPMGPAWGSKYTVNINTEMNYWPAEITNLGECAEPLFAMIKDLSTAGAATARTMYGAQGWVCHHNTDIWRGTAPVDYPPTGIWPMAGAWLSTHLWEHYAFTRDTKFLREAYPLMKGASEFFVDFLVPHPAHPQWLVTCPSFSPENGVLCAAPTMDVALLNDLFGQTAQAAEILGTDAEFREKILALRAKLPPFRVGKWGQFQEWMEDVDNPADTNRHVSHLYALHPSNQITKRGTPELFEAAKVTLRARGDAGTGWSLAWKINFWARLGDGEHAYLILTHLLSAPGSHGETFDTAGGTYPNLFDAHPPFQIDGNFGGAAGIAEMLLQSHAGEIELLPALPKAWPAGNVRGLRARGGVTVDIEWRDGKLTSARLFGPAGHPLRLRYRETMVNLVLPADGTLVWPGPGDDGASAMPNSRAKAATKP